MLIKLWVSKLSWHLLKKSNNCANSYALTTKLKFVVNDNNKKTVSHSFRWFLTLKCVKVILLRLSHPCHSILPSS